MAGLIAANSPAYRGMAPGARIVSVKVGVADGGTDVSQVIAAIDWVVQHRHDGDLNIRIINLSYGTNSAQDYKVDPLAYAAERAWKEGIVVVAAGGNYGFQSHMNNAPALSDPAIDRYVIAVGASDSNGTLTQLDDKVPAFSPWPKRGATRSVDLIAPGAHIQGLRVPESYLDQNHPEGQLGSRYFRGSGTSESAAMVSGAAALILDKHPGASPDEVKKLLTSTAFEISRQGTGDRRRRAATRDDPGHTGAQLDPDLAILGRFGQARAVARHRPPDARWRRTERRAGHLRSALRLGRDGGARGERQQLVGCQVERELMVRQQLVGQLVERQLVVGQSGGPAIAGRAARGRASSGPAAAGAATPGPATAGRRAAGTSRHLVASGGSRRRPTLRS